VARGNKIKRSSNNCEKNTRIDQKNGRNQKFGRILKIILAFLEERTVVIPIK
jgi:hypothetical protein